MMPGHAFLQRVRRFKHYLWQEPNPVVQIFYMLLVVGGYGAFLATGLPQLPTAFLGEIHILLSFLAVLGAVQSFIAASTTLPGILLPQTLAYFDNYAYDNEFYSKRICSTCKTIKLARSKHCSICNICVPRFDHHCVWLNSCIGEENHLSFLRFLLMNVVLCSYGSYVLFFLLYGNYLDLMDESFIDERTQTSVKGDNVVVLRYLIHSEATIFILFSLCSIMGVAVLAFFLFHCYLVARNLTTNEFFKRRAKRLTRPHPYHLGSVKQNFLEVVRPRFAPKLKEFLRRRARLEVTQPRR
ncbi:hypothetical protein Poli38472_006769 [Pythium oligandrum]|uniref:Palmitoyltransferase n=1 Tax=Pythium oligandrum TaxID=41045 RepID=A0A8K1FDC9_PYTOL|nr:hypothetical protein Poli38472_006769 [Pythium oligandrum]|eukprot:TMW56759.1 hypothetical protein Poli38472_006769 [Pythium oligandrum]